MSEKTQMPDEIYIVGKDALSHGEFEKLTCMWSESDTWDSSEQYTRTASLEADLRSVRIALELCVVAQTKKERHESEMACAFGMGVIDRILGEKA